MQATDKMVDAACEAYDLRSVMPSSCERAYMKSAIQAAIQAAWVKFDINDKSTHPQPKD